MGARNQFQRVKSGVRVGEDIPEKNCMLQGERPQLKVGSIWPMDGCVE